jgi:hypothetical protein
MILGDLYHWLSINKMLFFVTCIYIITYHFLSLLENNYKLHNCLYAELPTQIIPC